MLNLRKLESTTNYKIYLVNEGSTSKNFWCFLQEPVGVPSSGVYANSDTMLSVVPNYAGTNTFTIPFQYKVAAGASNKAVGLNVQIDSSIMQDSNLEQLWNADYVTVTGSQGPQGPSLSLNQSIPSPKNTIGIRSNSFDQVQNENKKWFGNMSFGLESSNGFLGVTWTPSPSNTSTITPKFAFYVATGAYSSNSLADIATISNDSAKIELTDFKNLEATVTLTSSGTWLVTPGSPS
ncbi:MULTISPECIES: hypothetical protein [unclassified Olleya]|uniref:hypothetical protein n=1 Tax=unclassified Olleya TaxID=2615019 RepID=UPI000C314B1A|nr:MULTISPECIES: hypothetical protein [unclassified Olleya]AUC76395.1 hypothetical protein CW732_12255 [Olleya sp. Bg11-27]QXP58664.1 hypothetical protein H0I26_12150 [Olleya sp. HaHaR_3_96]